MEHHELVIQIAPDGTVKLEVQGVKGSACIDLTKELEEDIGKVLTREKKPEYFSVETQTEAEKKIKTERG